MSDPDRLRLRHMLDAAREAVTFTQGHSLADVERDRLLQLALTRLIEVIGEAASKLSPAFRRRYPVLPWPDIVGMRNRLIHGYDDVDLVILHTTIEQDLPPLIAAIEALLTAEAPPSPLDGP